MRALAVLPLILPFLIGCPDDVVPPDTTIHLVNYVLPATAVDAIADFYADNPDYLTWNWHVGPSPRGGHLFGYWTGTHLATAPMPPIDANFKTAGMTWTDGFGDAVDLAIFTATLLRILWPEAGIQLCRGTWCTGGPVWTPTAWVILDLHNGDPYPWLYVDGYQSYPAYLVSTNFHADVTEIVP